MLVFFVRPAKAVADVEILSHTGYIDSFGSYHVVGEVRNVGDQAAKLVSINVVFYDSNATVITDRFDLTMLDIVLPQRRSPFDISLLDATLSAKVDHYGISVTSTPADSVPANLDVSMGSSYVDKDGGMHTLGEVTNLGNETATNLKLVVTYYGEGNVVGATWAYLDPEEPNLGSGLTKSFDILLGEDRTPYVDSYELTAESTEYISMPELVLIPEFSTWESGLILFGLLAIVAIVWTHVGPACTNR